jgi:hypothetical protein
MISSAPITVKNDFESQLQKLADEKKLDSVKRYFDFLKNDKDKLTPEQLITGQYRNIDPRLDQTKYFYFPTESTYGAMNCFERSASVYFAFKELYPQSKPSLIYLTLKDKSVHAMVLFEHDDDICGADPTREIFGKIVLRKDKLIIPKSGEFAEKSYEFEDISSLDDNILDQMARKLRCQAGIVDFLNESGQIAAHDRHLTMDGYLFMYMNEANQVTSEIRYGTSGIRMTMTPENRRMCPEGIKFKNATWRGLEGEEKIPALITNPYNNPINAIEKRKRNSYPIEDTVFFLKNVMRRPFSFEEIMQYEKSPGIQARFGNKIQKAKTLSPGTYLGFLNYLRFRFGPAKNLVPLKDWEKITLTNQQGVEQTLDMPIFESHFEDMNLEDILLTIKFTEDAKKYSQEVSRQLI